jgi:predicted nucleic acid-binding protein
VKPGLFLDTSGWFAALSERDPHHVRAAAYYRDTLDAGRFALVTTNLVVAEMHALMTRARGVVAGVQFLDRLYDDTLHEIVWATRDLQRQAIDRWLRPFRDHHFSLTDAVSFEVMRSRGLDAALATDRHFAAAAFRLVP